MERSIPQCGWIEMPDRPATSENDRDFILMSQVALGDEAAFRELVERHQHAVVGVIAKMLRDPIEAEDLAQQVFLRIWKHAARWRPEAKFTTYLFTIARRLVYNESRRRSRRREVSSEARHDSGGYEPATAHRDRPDAETERGEDQDRIDQAIRELPETQRTAVILYAYESLSYEQIAEVLETSVPSVKSLLFRARRALKERLADLLPG